jgi:hypothetical protein
MSWEENLEDQCDMKSKAIRRSMSTSEGFLIPKYELCMLLIKYIMTFLYHVYITMVTILEAIFNFLLPKICFHT